jgi:hypothetical protein
MKSRVPTLFFLDTAFPVPFENPISASLRYRELQTTSDAAQSDLRAEIKVKSFEVDRAQLLKEETMSQMKQVKLQNEMLQAKVKVGLLTQGGFKLL